MFKHIGNLTSTAKVMYGLALSVLIFTLGAPIQANELRKIRIGTEGAYAPWNATDPSGKLVGFEIDLGKDMCKRMKVECEFVAQDWDGIIPALQQGRYDAIMAGMAITATRLQVIDFSAPYAAEPAAFAAKKGSPLIGIPVGGIDLDADAPERQQAVDVVRKALAGKVVGVQISTAQVRMMETLWPEVKVRTYGKADEVVLDLAAGRIDVMLANRSAVEAIGRAHPEAGLELIGPTFTRGVLGRGVGAGVRKQDADLKDMLDKAIADASRDGTITKMSLQHFGYDVSVAPR